MEKNFLKTGLPFLKMGINPVNTVKMKRLFALLIIAGSLVACNNNGGDTASNVEDSVKTAIDSIGEARVDSVKEATDSLAQKVDATFEKTDSANKAIADSAKKR